MFAHIIVINILLFLLTITEPAKPRIYNLALVIVKSSYSNYNGVLEVGRLSRVTFLLGHTKIFFFYRYKHIMNNKFILLL